MLHIIDYNTKYAEAIALLNHEAGMVVRALEQVFARHGMPCSRTKAKNFKSHLVASMFQLFGIEKRRTIAHRPQTERLFERFNEILKSLGMNHALGATLFGMLCEEAPDFS